MGDLISKEEDKQMTAHANKTSKALVELARKAALQISEAAQTREHLRLMGNWFLEEQAAGRPLTEKSISFYIRQLELSNKI